MFCIYSALYHLISAFYPAGDTLSAYAQLYIYDSFEKQLERREQEFCNLDPATLCLIQAILFEVYSFVQVLCDSAMCIRADRSTTLRIGIKEAVATDLRTYNLLTV